MFHPEPDCGDTPAFGHYKITAIGYGGMRYCFSALRMLKMLKHLAPGDVVTVTRSDRLARSTFDLFGIVKRIVDAKRNSGHWLSRGPTPAPAPGG